MAGLIPLLSAGVKGIGEIGADVGPDEPYVSFQYFFMFSETVQITTIASKSNWL